MTNLKQRKTAEWLTATTSESASLMDIIIKTQYKDRILNTEGLLLLSDINTASDICFLKYGKVWDRRWTVFNVEYNPVWNVDGTTTVTTTRNFKQTDTGTDVNAESGADTRKNTGTQTNASTGADTQNNTGTQRNAEGGSESVANTGTQINAETGTDTQKNTGTESNGSTGTDSTSHEYGIEADTVSYGEKTTVTDIGAQETSSNIGAQTVTETIGKAGINTGTVSTTDTKQTETGARTDTVNNGAQENKEVIQGHVDTTQKGGHTDTDSTTYGKTETRTDDLTQETEYGKTDTRTDDLTQATTFGKTDTRTDNLTQTTEYGKTDTQTNNLTESMEYGHTNTRTADLSHTDTGTETVEEVRGGNIGVTMTQQMMQADLDYWAQAAARFFDSVILDIVNELTYKIYTVSDESNVNSDNGGSTTVTGSNITITPVLTSGTVIARVKTAEVSSNG